MKKKLLSIALIGIMTLSLAACGSSDDSADSSTADGELKTVTLMLDYTPNTNHTGFYVAQDLGYYEEAGLNVEIVEPGDNATTSMVATGNADFGVSYQEDVTYALTAEEALPIKTIATIIQHNTSGFVSLADAGIESPADFEGKTYAGWGAPSEEAVIEAVMKKAGADFSKLTIVGADGSGFASLSAEEGGNNVNIQWEFYGWAVTQGLMDGYDLNYIACSDLDERLDYYTPVIITNNDLIESDPDTIQAFMDATKKGYEYAIENPEESAEILQKTALPDTDIEFLTESQKYLSEQYSLDSDVWGMMKDSVWDNYTDFMYEYGLIDHTIEAADQYTNQFVEE